MVDTNSPPLLCCIGTNHNASPLAFRERIYLDNSVLALLMPRLKERFSLDELLVISTCNRFELYTLCKDAALSASTLAEIFRDLQFLATKVEIPRLEEISAATYCFYGNDTIRHLMAVACSVDSMVVGETQITGQVKSALSNASAAGTLGPILSRLGQAVLATVKKVRSQTAIGEKTVSISHAAIDLAKRVFHSISDHTMVVLGAGEMAEITAHYALSFKPRNLYVVNRTVKNAEALVARLGHGKAMGLAELPTVLREADIVICASATVEPLITYAMVKEVMAARNQRLLYVVDIAIPRNIDPACTALENLYLFDIDDLQKLVDEHRAERNHAAQAAKIIIERGAEQFSQWLRAAPIKPALEGFHLYLEDLLTRELSRTLTAARFRELSHEQSAALKNMMTAIAKKIVGDAAVALHRDHDLPGQRQQLLAALSMLFSPPPAPTKTGPSTKELQWREPTPRTLNVPL